MSEYKLSVTDAAEMLNVRPMTVRRWIQEGKLAAIRVPGTKPYKLRQLDVDALISGSAVVPEPQQVQTNDGMAGMDSAAMLLNEPQAEAP